MDRQTEVYHEVDPHRAVTVLGEFVLAVERRHVADAIGAWRRYVQALDRDPILQTRAPYAPSSSEPTADGWALIQARVLQTARYATGPYGVGFWQQAAQTMAQLAANAAERAGLTARHYLIEALAEARRLEEPAAHRMPLTDDLVASLAAQAAHFGRVALGEPGVVPERVPGPGRFYCDECGDWLKTTADLEAGACRWCRVGTVRARQEADLVLTVSAAGVMS